MKKKFKAIYEFDFNNYLSLKPKNQFYDPF